MPCRDESSSKARALSSGKGFYPLVFLGEPPRGGSKERDKCGFTYLSFVSESP